MIHPDERTFLREHAAYEQVQTGNRERPEPRTWRDKKVRALREDGWRWREIYRSLREERRNANPDLLPKGRPGKLNPHLHAYLLELREAYGLTLAEIRRFLAEVRDKEVSLQTVSNYLKRECGVKLDWRDRFTGLLSKVARRGWGWSVYDSTRRPLSQPMPMHIAAALDDFGVLDVLLRRRETGRGDLVNSTECAWEWTPLHFAAAEGCEDAAEKLIEAGADLDRREAGCRLVPLHLAAGLDQAAMVDLLVEAGADVAAEEKAGRTPLAMASGKEGARIVEAILSGGFRSDSMRRDAANVLREAVRSGDLAVGRVLVRHGARLDSQDRLLRREIHASGREVAELLEEALGEDGA